MQGSPVWLIPLGLADLQGLLAAVDHQQIINFALRILETSAVILRKTSTPSKLNRHSFVFDLTGLRATVRLSSLQTGGLLSLSFSFLLELFVKRSSDDSSQNYPNLPRKLSRNPEINVLHKLSSGLQALPDGFEEESEEKDSEQSFHNARATELGKTDAACYVKHFTVLILTSAGTASTLRSPPWVWRNKPGRGEQNLYGWSRTKAIPETSTQGFISTSALR